jgi:hypothetical protein
MPWKLPGGAAMHLVVGLWLGVWLAYLRKRKNKLERIAQDSPQIKKVETNPTNGFKRTSQ